MITTPNLRACQYEVLADRLALWEAIDANGARSKRALLAQVLLKRHPELGDRVAREVVAETLDAWPCCIRGLEALAEELVQLRGGEPFFKTDVEWRLVRSLLDEDQLLAARIATLDHFQGDLYVPPDALALVHDPVLPALDEDLTEVLEEPLAEVHLHLGGAAPPITFWLPLVLGLFNLQVAGAMAADGTSQEEGVASPLDELRDRWTHRLLEAASLRYHLAARLPHLTQEQDRHPFWWVHGLRSVADDRDCPLPSTSWTPLRLVEEFRCLLEGIGYLRRGEDAPPSNDGGGCRILLEPDGAIPYRDPLALAVEHVLGLPADVESPALGERYLVASALRYLRRWKHDALPDEAARFRERLLRYLRIKQSLLRLLVHYPGVHGLDRFRQRYDRRNDGIRNPGPARAQEVWLAASIRYQMRRTVLRWLAASTRRPLLPQRPPASRSIERTTALLAAAGSRLERRLEVRISVDAGRFHNLNVASMARGLRDALAFLDRGLDGNLDTLRPRASSAVPFLQSGVVFHLQKQERVDAAAYDEIMNRLLLWLDDHPEWRPFILGVDVAAPELDAPPSRFVQAYRRVTRRRERGARSRDGIPLRLGKTFHVGEDFRDLLTGVRQVAWTLDLLEMEAGDRLGHGLAIGLDPKLWYARRGSSFPRQGDHLLDLLWARRFLKLEREAHGESFRAPIRCVERRLLELTSPDAEALVDELDKEWDHWYSGLSKGEAASPGESEMQLQERLSAMAGLSGGAGSLVDVRPDEAWVSLVTTLQRVVIRSLDRNGLHVEANPTSNLLIAGLTDFAELPIVRLHPVARPEPGDLPVLSLSVSTDDPEIFRVNLREEYDALFKALLQQGRYGRRELLEWIDRLRRDGWVSSFLTNESPRGRELLQYLASLFPDERLGAQAADVAFRS